MSSSRRTVDERIDGLLRATRPVPDPGQAFHDLETVANRVMSLTSRDGRCPTCLQWIDRDLAEGEWLRLGRERLRAEEGRW